MTDEPIEIHHAEISGAAMLQARGFGVHPVPFGMQTDNNGRPIVAFAVMVYLPDSDPAALPPILADLELAAHLAVSLDSTARATWGPAWTAALDQARNLQRDHPMPPGGFQVLCRHCQCEVTFGEDGTPVPCHCREGGH
jgi:hypothetical protein